MCLPVTSLVAFRERIESASNMPLEAVDAGVHCISITRQGCSVSEKLSHRHSIEMSCLPEYALREPLLSFIGRDLKEQSGSLFSADGWLEDWNDSGDDPE